METRCSGLSVTVLLFVLAGGAVAAETLDSLDPGVRILQGLNRTRHGLGCDSVSIDPLLSQAALAHARNLAARGSISHIDGRGGKVRDRVQALGVTTAAVGEVIGAGADVEEIVAAWEVSESHRRVITYRPWTHTGIGCVRSGEDWVAVAVFSAERARDLRLDSEGRLLRGEFLASDVGKPVLLVDARSHDPEYWNPLTRCFSFTFDRAWLGDSYLRLGYYTERGSLVITDVLHSLSRFPGL